MVVRRVWALTPPPTGKAAAAERDARQLLSLPVAALSSQLTLKLRKMQLRTVGCQHEGPPGSRARVDVCTSHNNEQPTSRKHQKQGQADRRSHAHPQGIRLVPKHENMLRTTPRNPPVPQRSPPSPSLLLTSAWQPPAEGPDHLGTPKALEAGSNMPVVPLQRARLHDPAERRSSGPWHCRGRDRQVCAGRDRRARQPHTRARLASATPAGGTCRPGNSRVVTSRPLLTWPGGRGRKASPGALGGRGCSLGR